MGGFDLHKFLINDQPYTFLFEVIARVFIAYAVVFSSVSAISGSSSKKIHVSPRIRWQG